MKTNNNSEHQMAFTQGWNSLETHNGNPYITSSNMADAFNLGTHARLLGFPITISGSIHKSTGYTWKLGGSKFVSDCGEVKLISSHPIYA